MKNKNIYKNNLEEMGWYIKRYKKLYLIIMSIIASFELIMIIRGILTFDFSNGENIGYIISYSLLFFASIAMIIILLLIKKKKISPELLALILHCYCAVAIICATVISMFDIQNGNYPIVYLIVIVTIGGIVAINPIVYISLTGATSVILMIDLINSVIFNDIFDYLHLLVFLIMAFMITYRMYKVSLQESKFKDFLRKASFTDQLTGLGNETSYYKMIETIDQVYEKYGVIVMDVNGLKATNDAYGHRYGCHLVVLTGHTLPTIFKNSKLYHIGGDEFVCILINEDYENRKELLKNFEEKLTYSIIEYEGHDLIFSVAKGMAIKKGKEPYKEVFQKADDAMYIDKKEVKEKFNIQGR